MIIETETGDLNTRHEDRFHFADQQEVADQDNGTLSGLVRDRGLMAVVNMLADICAENEEYEERCAHLLTSRKWSEAQTRLRDLAPGVDL